MHAMAEIAFKRHECGQRREGLRPCRVYFARTDGSEIREVVGEIRFPNGIGVTGDGRTLIGAESFTSSLLAFDITAPGVLANRRVFATLPEGHLPDGFCFDAEGTLICAGAEGGALAVFGPDETPRDPVPVADPLVTNVAFGGRGFSTLYLTESTLGRVVLVDWPVPDQPLVFTIEGVGSRWRSKTSQARSQM